MKVKFKYSKLKTACFVIYFAVCLLTVPTITIDKTMEILNGTDFRKGLHYYFFLLSINCLIHVSRVNLKRRCFNAYSKSKSLRPSIWYFYLQSIIPSVSLFYFLLTPSLLSLICMPELPQVGGFFMGITIGFFLISLVTLLDIPFRTYRRINSSLLIYNQN
jgi:hypothetical protein